MERLRFNEKAAKLIVQILKHIENDQELIFAKHTNDTWFRKWEESGYANVTLKDLRRASLGYLGHHTKFELVPLKNHARHSKVDTTMQYLRRPAEKVEDKNDYLDLEA